MSTNWQFIVASLQELYPDAHCELVHANPFQLLIATILSAQCTDERVNKVTPLLFAKYQNAADLGAVSQEELESLIKSCGLFRSKAKNIIACCQMLCDLYACTVPTNLEDLQQLPGVGRKTANVVGYNAFGIPAMAVDTHVFRVAHRLGLSSGTTPDKVENDLTAVLPSELWGPVHHLLIWHGRRMCTAQRPNCDVCPLQGECLYFKGLESK